MKCLRKYWIWSLCCMLLLTACSPARSQSSPQAEQETVLEPVRRTEPEAETEAVLSESAPESVGPEKFVPPKLDQPTETPLDFPAPGEIRTLAAVGLGSCLVIAPDGDLVGWGPCERAEFPGYHDPLSFEERRVFLKNIQQVYKSFSTSAALDRDGNFLVWSTPQDRELGHTSAQSTEYPEVYLAMDQLRMADIGMGYAAVIREDGSLWVWGRNMFGQLGDGTCEDSSVPRKMLDNAAFVFCNLFETFVITKDHKLYAAGFGGSTLRCIAMGAVEVNTLSSEGYSVLTTDGRVYQCRSARTGPEDTSDVILYDLCAENAKRLLPGGYVDTDGTFWFLSAGQPPVRVADHVVDYIYYNGDENTGLLVGEDGILREIDCKTLEEVCCWPLAELVP